MNIQWLFNQTVYTNVSVWMAIVPAIVCLLTIRYSSQSVIMFILLTLGLLTELFTKIQGETTTLTIYAFLFYSYIEATVFYCIVRQPEHRISIQNVLKAALLFSLPMLLLCYAITSGFIRTIGVYNMAYEIVISFLAGRQILRLIEEKTEVTKNHAFWLLIGIFIYCFTTFFLMGVIELSATRELWDLYHNTINIVTCCVFALSFWTRYRLNAVTQFSSMHKKR